MKFFRSRVCSAALLQKNMKVAQQKMRIMKILREKMPSRMPVLQLLLFKRKRRSDIFMLYNSEVLMIFVYFTAN